MTIRSFDKIAAIDPIDPADLATKAYVDAQAGGGGGGGTVTPIADFNLATATGLYWSAGNAINSPADIAAGMTSIDGSLMVVASDATNCTQLWVSKGSAGDTWTRIHSNGSWWPWARVYGSALKVDAAGSFNMLTMGGQHYAKGNVFGGPGPDEDGLLWVIPRLSGAAASSGTVQIWWSLVTSLMWMRTNFGAWSPWVQVSTGGGGPDPNLPLGQIASVVGPAATVDCISTGATVLTLTAHVNAGRRYHLHINCWGAQVSATGTSYFALPDATHIDSAQPRFAQYQTPLAAGQYLPGNVTYRYTPATSGLKTWLLRGVSSAGAMRVTAGQCTMTLEDIGPAVPPIAAGAPTLASYTDLTTGSSITISPLNWIAFVGTDMDTVTTVTFHGPTGEVTQTTFRAQTSTTLEAQMPSQVGSGAGWVAVTNPSGSSNLHPTDYTTASPLDPETKD